MAEALAGEKFATDLTIAPPGPIWADRPRAAVGAWYELFPRSFGGLRGAAGQLPRLAGLGFDVLYLPPVHPIGHTFRKGRDNSLTAGPGDPGSPWAIGSDEGGHTALHPELGTFDDFDYLVRTAAGHGMEVALDYALNARPTTPGSRSTPSGSITARTVRSPTPRTRPRSTRTSIPSTSGPGPKQPGWRCGRRARRSSTSGPTAGVRIFRVDNPHTKPFAFWEWLVERRCAGSTPTSSCWPRPSPGPR